MEYHGNFSAASRQGENEVLEVLMDENEMIMTDEELMVACEFTPYNRQSTLIPLLLYGICQFFIIVHSVPSCGHYNTQL